jgi:tetratricopeptide (TPR) repeat protein
MPDNRPFAITKLGAYRFALSTALLLAIPVHAFAATPDDLAEARAHLRDSQEERAIVLLSRSLDRQDASPGLTRDIYLLLAHARFNLGDEEGARLAVRRAGAVDPHAILAPIASPKFLALFEEEIANLQHDSHPTTTVGSKPDHEPASTASSAPRARVESATPLRDPVAASVKDLAEATRLLLEADWERAICVLSRALDRSDPPAAVRRDAYLLLGHARFNLFDEEGAQIALRNAVDADPHADLPRGVSPKLLALFKDVRRTLKAGPETTPEAPSATASHRVEPGTPSSAAPPAKLAASDLTSRPSQLSGRRVAGLAIAASGFVAAIVGGAMIAWARDQRAMARDSPDAAFAERRFDVARAANDRGLGALLGGLPVAALGLAMFYVTGDVVTGSAPRTARLEFAGRW